MGWQKRKAPAYRLGLSVSLPPFLFPFLAGTVHSSEKAMQLVHGIPRLVASHRTFRSRQHRKEPFEILYNGRRPNARTFLVWQVY
jgi:hypothetical protein